MRLNSNGSFLVKILVMAASLLAAQAAHGVAAAPLVKDAESVDSVTTSAAIRANADVQIRRIKNLMVTTRIDAEDQSIVKIQRFQRDLRGEK